MSRPVSPEGGPEAVEYVRFANTDALDAYYSAISDPLSFANTQTLHGITCPGTNTYKANGRRAGGVKCYFANFDTAGRDSVDPYFHFTWSSTPTKVLAFAISPSADERAVMDWWDERGGPIVGRQRRGADYTGPESPSHHWYTSLASLFVVATVSGRGNAELALRPHHPGDLAPVRIGLDETRVVADGVPFLALALRPGARSRTGITLVGRRERLHEARRRRTGSSRRTPS